MNSLVISCISFNGYNNVLKDNWRKGKLPSVKYGIYGGELTQENLSTEHLRPVSKGGDKWDIANIALSTKYNNSRRSNNDITKYITKENADRYLDQFIDVNVGGFSGNRYIRLIKKTLSKLGVNFWKK